MKKVPFFYELIKNSLGSFLGKSSSIYDEDRRRTVPLAGAPVRTYTAMRSSDDELLQTKLKLEELLEKKM